MSTNGKLPDKQQAFANEYLIDLNASAAFRRADYMAAGNAAEVNAHRLLRNAKVQCAIQKAFTERPKRTQITQDTGCLPSTLVWRSRTFGIIRRGGLMA